MAPDTAFVTLATNDPYGLGAVVWCRSLKETQTAHSIVAIVTDGVSRDMRLRMEEVFDQVISVQQIDSNDADMLALLQRPELGITLTKLHVWRLTQFNKVVFMDADVLVVRNVDDLFDRPELSAAPDSGWPDCFNSGVFVCVPSELTFTALTNMLLTEGSFDGGDQGLLNQYFSNWSTQPDCRLPFTYNVVPGAFYTYQPALRRFMDDIRIIHFAGMKKPWLSRNRDDVSSHVEPFIRQWWTIHDRYAKGRATPGLPATITSDSNGSPESGPRSPNVTGTDPRTLTAERLAHLQNFGNYRISWEDAARLGGGRALPSAPLAAMSPRPREEWVKVLTQQIQEVNDKLQELRNSKRDDKQIEKLEEERSRLTEIRSALKTAPTS